MLSKKREMAERAAQKIEWPDFIRASGDLRCKECGEKYYDHPEAVPFLCLQILCTGEYVKL